MFDNLNNNYEFNRNISVENIRYNVRRTISIPAKILTIPTFLLFFLILYPATISAIPPIKNKDSKSRKGPFNSIDLRIKSIKEYSLFFVVNYLIVNSEQFAFISCYFKQRNDKSSFISIIVDII